MVKIGLKWLFRVIFEVLTKMVKIGSKGFLGHFRAFLKSGQNWLYKAPEPIFGGDPIFAQNFLSRKIQS